MNKLLGSIVLIVLSISLWAQPVGYYNGISALKGKDLKSKLNEIISDHVDFSYSQSKFIINYSDADPANENNVILFYTQRSQNANTYGTEDNSINREHVWAKSHGNFSGIRPMDGDAFNLRPADASVNITRSNKDFGNVKPNGTQNPEATECWFTNDVWEPGDATKGQVARIIFYMATRYEGKKGELDLEVVNGYNTYPKPEHGDLATLLEWNRMFPPTEFERVRNERIFTVQQNRNPFVDDWRLADLIWNESAVQNKIRIDSFSMVPEYPKAGESAKLSFKIGAETSLNKAVFYWGKTYESKQDSIVLDSNIVSHELNLDLSEFSDGDMVHYWLVCTNTNMESNSSHGSFILPNRIDVSEITPIASIKGNGNVGPMLNKTVTVAGRIVANFDNAVYIQSDTSTYSGLCIYGSLKTGFIGDSIVLTGTVTEYNMLTEINDVSYLYNFSNNKVLKPIVINTSQIGEEYEGMLVTIKNAVFEDAGTEVPDENVSYTFNDALGSGTVYFRYGSRMLNKKLPDGVTDITGIVSQFQDTYQILPRSIEDFSAGLDTIPPQIATVTVIDKAWVTVEFNERVELNGSENIDNYAFSDGISILSAYRYPEGKTVILNVEGMSKGSHSLTISNIKDLSGNEIKEVTIEFNSAYTGVNNLAANLVKVYPNPVENKELNIECTNASSLSIFALSGVKVYESPIQSSQIKLNLNINSGVYLLMIHQNNGSAIRTKLFIE